MAKVTKYKNDNLGASLLNVAAYVLIIGLSASGQLHHWQYYIWALLASYFWGDALHARHPIQYKTLQSGRTYSLVTGIGIIFMVTMFTYVLNNPESFRQFITGPNPAP